MAENLNPRVWALRCALLARAEPDLPIESVVFQASLPDRVIGTPPEPHVLTPESRECGYCGGALSLDEQGMRGCVKCDWWEVP